MKQFIVYALAWAIILLSAYPMQAQTGQDSLRSRLQQHSGADTTMVQLLLQLANKYERINADSVTYLSQRSLRISSKIKYNRGITESYELIGVGYEAKGKYDSALYYYHKAIAAARVYDQYDLLASKYNHIANTYFITGKYADAHIYYDSAIQSAHKYTNPAMEAKASSNLANVYYKNGHYAQALTYYLKGLKMQEQLGLKENITSDLANIANVYYRLGKYDEAINYTNRTVAMLKESGNKERMAGALTTYALVYNDRKMYDSSLHYLNEALQLAEEINSPYLVNILKGNIAEAYQKKGDNRKALELYEASAAMSVKLDDAEGLAIAKAGMGNAYIATGNAAKGRQYLAEALSIMQQLGIKEQVLDIAQKLSASYEQAGEYKQALYYNRLSNSTEDSLQKEQAAKDAEQMLFDYELQKKEAQIKLLEKDNAIIEAKDRIQKVLLSAAVIVLLFMGIALYLFYVNLRNTKKNNKQLKQQQAEMTKQSARLQELNELKDAALSLLAHDLRNPVSALTSTMMMLDEGMMEPSEFAMYKQELTSKLQTVSLLLENMLQWAQGQMKGETEPKTEKLNMRQKAARVITVLQDTAAPKNISLQNNVPDDVWAMCDRDHIDIVVRNIVSNAIKFTPDNGAISISSRKEQDRIAIDIADNGVGMTPEQAAHLFSGDTYASTKGTKGEKGTGLGLRLSYELIKRNNGDITVNSAPGKGSVFTITLPAA